MDATSPTQPAVIPASPPTAVPATVPIAVSATAATSPSSITIDDFAKIDLRVATVLECRPHTKGTRLLVLQLDLGNGERRQICAGLRQHVAPDTLIGKQIVIVANLAPREMLGEVSHGMLLAASDATGKISVLSPMDIVSPGSQVR